MSTTHTVRWTPQTIEEKVTEIIVEQMAVDGKKVTRDVNLFTDLAMDSLDIIEVSMRCEDVFDVHIPDDVKDFQTVGDVIAFVISQTAEAKKE